MSVIQKIANYTVQQGDSGYTIALAGNAFFTLTFPNPTTMPTDFTCTVLNADLWTGGGRAKFLSFTSPSNPASRRLWPGQSINVSIVNGAWQAEFKRAKLPGSDVLSTITFFVDPSAGSNDPTAVDGLAASAGAYKSIQSALVALIDEFDFTASVYGATGATFTTKSTKVIVELAADATDTQQIVLATHSNVGLIDTGAIVVNLNGGTLTCSAGDTVKLFRGSYFGFRNGTIGCTFSGGVALHAFDGAQVFILDGITIGTSSATGADIQVEGGDGSVQIQSNYIVAAGTRAAHIVLRDGGTVRCGTINATLAGNVTFSDAVISNTRGVADLTGLTFVLSGHTVTGAAFDITELGVILNASTLPGTPGSYGLLQAGGDAGQGIEIFDRTAPAEMWNLLASGSIFTFSNDTFGNVATFAYATGKGIWAALQQMPGLTLPALAPPGTPASGFVLYCDNSDGNKLKAKASTGTVTVLANP